MEQLRRVLRNEVQLSRNLCGPPWSLLQTRATREKMAWKYEYVIWHTLATKFQLAIIIFHHFELSRALKIASQKSTMVENHPKSLFFKAIFAKWEKIFVDLNNSEETSEV